MTNVTQRPTTVPFRYRARLELSEPVGDSKQRQRHEMHVTGAVHPEPYNMATATELAQIKLQPFLELGWQVESLVVNGYAAEEA